VRLPEIKAQLVNLTTSVVGKRAPIDLGGLLDAGRRARDTAGARTGTRDLYAGGRWHAAAIYAREVLPLGAEIIGPAVVEQIDATTVIEPGTIARVDDLGNLRLRRT
jgi:N-methylhydantoinase A